MKTRRRISRKRTIPDRVVADARNFLHQSQHTRILDTYTTLVQQTDEQVLADFSRLMGQAQNAIASARRAYYLKLIISLILMLTGVTLGWIGQDLQQYVGIGVAVSGLLLLILLSYRSPLLDIRTSVERFTKVNIVLLGYIRQIHQVDAVFKSLYLAQIDTGDQSSLTTAIENLRDAVQKTIIGLDDYSVD